MQSPHIDLCMAGLYRLESTLCIRYYPNFEEKICKVTLADCKTSCGDDTVATKHSLKGKELLVQGLTVE